MPPLRSRRLPSLDLGRFIAALLVALYHNSFTVRSFSGQQPLALIFRGGHAGVEYFFVLSGFIIYYIHASDFSQPGRFVAFFRKRAVRILPMLWLVLIGWGLLRIVLAPSTTNGATGIGTLLADMALIPHGGPLVLGVTWTLQRELIFYTIFSLAILDRRVGIVAMLVWQASVVLVIASGHPLASPFAIALFDIHNLAFGLGMLAAAITLRGRLIAPSLWVGVGLVSFVALLLIEWRLGGAGNELYMPFGEVVGPIAYSLAAAAAIIGLAWFDGRGPVRDGVFARHAGGVSYILYLVHGPVSSLLIRLLPGTALPGWALLLATTAAGVAVSIVLHLRVERPVIAWLNGRRGGRARPVAAKGTA